MSAVFSVSLLFISEIYPTTIRNTGLGASLTISQIGSIIAPYVVEILVMKIIHDFKCVINNNYVYVFRGPKHGIFQARYVEL